MAIMRTECAREQDVLDAVAARRWDAELRAHIESCAICQDVRTVFAAMSEERDAAWEETSVPPASVIWWRAQIRAREEATRVATRPIAVAQAVAITCLLALAVALVPLALPWIRNGVATAAESRGLADPARRGGVDGIPVRDGHGAADPAVCRRLDSARANPAVLRAH